MATPYDLYIRFLLTTGIGSHDDVNLKLEDLNLPKVPLVSLEAQEALLTHTLSSAAISQIDKKSYCGDFLHWMKVIEVDDLWYYEKPFRDRDSSKRSAVKITYDIHQDAGLRLTVGALLIKGVPHPDLAQIIASRFSSFVREEHIALYEKYFFNVSRMTRKDWKNFLKSCPPHESRIYFTALSEPLDVVKTELELPAKISSSETLQYLLSKSYMKAKQYVNINTPESNAEARQWIDLVVKLVDKYEKYRSGDASDFGNALQLQFDFMEDEFVVPDSETLSELSSKLKKDTEE